MASFLRRHHFHRPSLRVDQVASAFSGAVGANRWSNKGSRVAVVREGFGYMHADTGCLL